MAGQGLSYTVDLVLCVDSTGSMGSLIDRVKEGALNFERDFQAALSEKSKEVNTLRVRVVAFRDFYADGASALESSDFFTLPQDCEAFASFVRGIEATGGGDAPESGLEALVLAMQSAWNAEGDRRRHVIVIWTDTAPHPLEKNRDGQPAGYPADMPSGFDELTDLWQGQEALMNANAKRLIVFAPDAPGWNEIGEHWTQALHYASQAGDGLADHEYKTILSTIAESV